MNERLREALAKAGAEVRDAEAEAVKVNITVADAEARIQELEAALKSLDFLEEDYDKWPWMVKRRVEEARRALAEDEARG